MPSVKKPTAPVVEKVVPKRKIVPATPETNSTAGKGRKRLAKAFARPLDKSLKSVILIRDKYSMPEDEYTVLLALKQQLAEQGVMVKKSDLLRAGLLLIASLDESELRSVLEKVPPIA